MSDELTRGQRAQRTAKWARTMTKWLITKYGGANVLWQFVEFGGVTGSESYGIVDMVAIRKDHRTIRKGLKRGDLFDIVLVQTKGGRARRPSDDDVARLIAVAEHHRARGVVLAQWRKGEDLSLYQLVGGKWEEANPANIFK